MTERIADLESVRAAIEELRAEGRAQTVRNIRERVGGGSFDTLRPLIKKVLEAETAVPKDDEARFRPILEASASVLRAIVLERTTGFKETIARLEADLDDASNTITNQSEVNAGLQEKIGNLEKEINELKALVDMREKDAREAREQLRGAEKEASNYVGQNEQLVKQNEQLNKQIEQLISRTASTKVEANESAKTVASAGKKPQKITG